MYKIADIRDNPGDILAVGAYRQGYQAILDFDMLCERDKPSIIGIVGSTKRFEKYFWGNEEVLIPCFQTIADAKRSLPSVEWLLNITSARRAYQTTEEFFTAYPDARGAHIFAEDVPEVESLKLYDKFSEKGKTIVGPSGVGLIVPGSLKLGAIGGVDWRQIQSNGLYQPGSVAVLSASGGMINELITISYSSVPPNSP